MLVRNTFISVFGISLAACSAATAPTSENAIRAQRDRPAPNNTVKETTAQSSRTLIPRAGAFPGAEGFGTKTPGGRGGDILVVTNLEADGPGSFADALQSTGPRIIVFRVSGVIDLGGQGIDLSDANSYVTVLGQSSPGGITLINGQIGNYHSNFHDAIFRFIRIRGANNGDNVSFNTAYNLVFDHCDFSGGSDEAFDVTSAHDVTVQWSTITNSRTDGSSQGYGTLLAYAPTTNISLHHNLSAHHKGRCGAQFHWADQGEAPVPATGAAVDIRNNVFYNCGFPQIYRSDVVPSAGVHWNLIGNYAKSGPDTPVDSMLFGISGQVYQTDNVYEGQRHIMSPYYEGQLVSRPFSFPAVTTTSSSVAYEQVLNSVGAWPRDAMNTRTVNEVRTKTGTLGKNDDPLLNAGPTPPADTDLDGIADSWEAAHGLSPSDDDDATRIHSSGYSNLEVYLNEVAAALIGK